jgi:ribose transport system ATP-binding protein
MGPLTGTLAGAGPAISVRDLTKSFGAAVVLSAVDVDLFPGRVHGLVGENGAGKSTLIKLLAGIYKQDRGSVTCQGEGVPPGRAAPAVSFIHQDLGLDPTLTVAENIALVTGYPRRWGLISWKAVSRRAVDALNGFELKVEPTALVSSLSAVERSLVAIARALSVEARVVVLDEPTAALPPPDVARLFAVIRSLRDLGVSFLYVSHRIGEIFEICDDVVVLRDGVVVARGAAEMFTRDDLVAHIIGTEGLANLEDTWAGHTRLPAAGSPVLTVRNLCTPGAGPVDLDVRRGEVLSLFGLAGSGQVQVGRALVGATRRSSGSMNLEGSDYAPRSPVDAVGKGVVGFVAGDRVGESIAGGLTVQENLYINPGSGGQPAFRLIGHKAERQRALRALGRFDVRPRQPGTQIQLLSGGNQQKIVVARWVEAEVKLLVLEDPSAGVDVGARAQLHGFFRDLAAEGASVVVVSSDSEEVANLSDRVCVFGGGMAVEELTRQELSEHRLLAAANSAAQRVRDVGDKSERCVS